MKRLAQILSGGWSSVALIFCLTACSGKIIETTGDGDGDGDLDDGSGGQPDKGSGGFPFGAGGQPSGGFGGTGGVTYVDPECPESPAPPVDPECDPLDPYENCPPNEGCYPYLIYPAGEGCGRPVFGAECVAASTGEQGDFCGDGGNYCAPGFMCVVGATGGKRCGQICETVRDHECPDGLICGETDVQGFGVCF